MQIAPNFNITPTTFGLKVEIIQHRVGAKIVTEHRAGFLRGIAEHDKQVIWTPEKLASAQIKGQAIADHLFNMFIKPISVLNPVARNRALTSVIKRFNILINEAIANDEGQDMAMDVQEQTDFIERDLDVVAFKFNPNTNSVPVPWKKPIVVMPEPEPEPVVYLEGNTVMSYLAAISPQFLTPQSTLLAGTGIPGVEYTIARNDILELALTAYRRQNFYADRVVSNEIIELTLPNSGTLERWSVAWSAGLLNTEVGRLDTLYDIQLVLNTFADGTRNDATSIIFNLIWLNDKYVLQESTATIPDTVDSVSNADFTSVQNSIDYNWFKSVLTPVVPNAEPVLGNYVIELRATHKETANVVSVIADVIVSNAEPVV